MLRTRMTTLVGLGWGVGVGGEGGAFVLFCFFPKNPFLVLMILGRNLEQDELMCRLQE